jgi:uncharacterized membrane protein
MKTANVLKPAPHDSYQRHRRELWTQILLPVIAGALLFCIVPVAVWFVRTGGTGDVGQVSAVAAMWLMLPVMIGFVILLAVLVVAIYLAARLLMLLPTYSLRAQKFANTVAVETRRGAEMVRKPALAVRAAGNAALSRFRQPRERA